MNKRSSCYRKSQTSTAKPWNHSGILQRRAMGPEPLTEVPPIVHEVLRSPGHSLDAQTRHDMETHLGQDFSQVRVHTDDRAMVSAQAVNASAYTVGQEIVFAAGHYAPQSPAGKQLLAHELVHVIQQRGRSADPVMPTTYQTAEAEAEAWAQTIHSPTSQAVRAIGPVAAGLYRQQQTSIPTGMSRTEFEHIMRTRFKVDRIATGTEAEQRDRLTPRGGVPPGGITLPNWQSWDPGTNSEIYDSIVDGMEDFIREIGGLPSIREIVFFNVDYTLNSAGVGIPRPGTGASFGAGHLTIYRSLTTRPQPLPIDRSNPQGTYPSVVAASGGIPGQSPGAPLPFPTPDQSIRRGITHELGHGLAEAAMDPRPIALDPTMMADFQRAVGWTAAHPAELFDIGVAAVATAIAAGTPPPVAYQITEQNWNSPQWLEQPMTHYSVAGGPSEDFAETVTAFIHAPNLLLSRSPNRFRFLYSRKDRWLPRLMQFPQIGDFPMPRTDIGIT